MDCPAHFHDGTLAFYVDRLPRLHNLNSLLGADLRPGRDAAQELELAFVGQNLIIPLRAEFFAHVHQLANTEVPLSVYGNVPGF